MSNDDKEVGEVWKRIQLNREAMSLENWLVRRIVEERARYYSMEGTANKRLCMNSACHDFGIPLDTYED